MFIIVRKGNVRERVNMDLVKKYHDGTIKFANDHIIEVRETAKEMDLMITVATKLGMPVDLKMAQESMDNNNAKVT